MRLVEYTPDYFESLRRAAEQMSPTHSLSHRPFVDYYYTTRDWCKLYLFLSDDESVAATQGWERMRFEYEGRELTLGFGSNFWSLQKGAGGILFMQWMKACPISAVFGGTHDTHQILKNRKWTYFRGVRDFYLNIPPQFRPDEPRWRVAAKWLRYRLRPRTNLVALGERVPRGSGAGVSVREEHAYTADLLPRTSPFTFRFAPDLDYLAWRYALNLSFVRYRLFRIVARGDSTGYVILNETPRRLMVAQCDADDPTTLVHGVLLTLAEASRGVERPREVFLTLCHRGMQAAFQSLGFRKAKVDRPFVMGKLRGDVGLSSDTSNWLVNFDWGDNGLLVPFLDQVPV